MNRDPKSLIVIADSFWHHVRQIRAYHRGYPEVRGEGRSRRAALAHLANQLIRALDSAPGRVNRARVQRALDEVQAFGREVGRRRPPRHRDVAMYPELIAAARITPGVWPPG